MSKSRRMMLISVLLVIISMLSIAGTLAYLTDQRKAENVLKFGEIEIDVTGTNWDPKGTPAIELRPGITVNKDPRVSNLPTSMNCYVRARVTFTHSTGTVNKQNIMDFIEVPDLTGTGWSVSADDVTAGKVWGKSDTILLVYDKVLKPSESTNPIFTEFKLRQFSKINSALPFLEGANSGFEIQIVAEAVQTEAEGLTISGAEDAFKKLFGK